MKNNIITIILLALLSFNCKAQSIIPVENLVDYIDSEDGLPDTVTQVKDINGYLNKYIGTWKGTHQGKDYEFIVSKVSDDVYGVLIDQLLIHYTIRNSSDNSLIASNHNLPRGILIITGYYLSKNQDFYVLDYSGYKDYCGQNGLVYISINSSNSNLMTLKLVVDGEKSSSCTEDNVEQVLPTTNAIFTKQ